MIRLKKYLLVSGIMAFLLVITLYYNNSQSKNEIIKNDEETQSKIVIIQENEKDDSLGENVVTEDINSIETDKVNETSTINSLQVGINKDIEAKVEELVNKYYDVTNKLDTDILSSDSKGEVVRKVEIHNKKEEIIESYENIVNYIKPGLTDDTFVVFISYDIKLKNIETKVPGMSVLTVVKSKLGELHINIDPNDVDMNEYIKKLAEEKDIKDVIDDVNIRLNDAIKKDTSLKELVEYLNEMT